MKKLTLHVLLFEAFGLLLLSVFVLAQGAQQQQYAPQQQQRPGGLGQQAINAQFPRQNTFSSQQGLPIQNVGSFPSPSQQFGAPDQQFGAVPQQKHQFGNGQQQFGNGQQQFSAPPQFGQAAQNQFRAPQRQFGAVPQQQSFENSQQFRGIPQQQLDGRQFGSAQPQFGNAQQQFGGTQQRRFGGIQQQQFPTTGQAPPTPVTFGGIQNTQLGQQQFGRIQQQFGGIQPQTVGQIPRTPNTLGSTATSANEQLNTLIQQGYKVVSPSENKRALDTKVANDITAAKQTEMQIAAATQRSTSERQEIPTQVINEGPALSTPAVDAALPNINPLDPNTGATVLPIARAASQYAAQSGAFQGTSVTSVGPVATPVIAGGIAPIVSLAPLAGGPIGPTGVGYTTAEAANVKAHSVHNSHAYGLGSNQNIVTPSSSRFYQGRAFNDMASKAAPGVFGAGVYTQINTPNPGHPHGAQGYAGAYKNIKGAQHHIMASSFASPVHKGPANYYGGSNSATQNSALQGMFSNDVCSGYDIYQCKKFVYCHWYENQCSMVKSGTGAIFNTALYKTGSTKSKSISPFLISQTLSQTGDAIANAVSEVDLCYRLSTFYTCSEFFGCSWDGRYCVSSAISDDFLRDPCSDLSNTDICGRNPKCVWQSESLRCISQVGASAHAFPLANRYRARIQILGEGYTDQFQVKMSHARYQSDELQSLRARAVEFFKQQYGLDYTNNNEIGGTIMTAAKNSDALFFQVINADMPYGSSLIPRRNRVIFDKFIVHSKPSQAAVLRGNFAKYFLKYSVPLYPSELLEYGAMHIIDENDMVVLSVDYFYNYPCKPNPVGLVGLSAEISSSFGYGLMRGTDVVTPTYDGKVHVDSFYSVIIGSGDANRGSILSTGTLGLQLHGQFTPSGRGSGPHGAIHGVNNLSGNPTVSNPNARGHYYGGDTYAPRSVGGNAYGYPTTSSSGVGPRDISHATSPYNPHSSQIPYSVAGSKARGF